MNSAPAEPTAEPQASKGDVDRAFRDSFGAGRTESEAKRDRWLQQEFTKLQKLEAEALRARRGKK